MYLNELLDVTFSNTYRNSHRTCSKKCSHKFRKIHRKTKTPVRESLFNKVVGLRPATLLKKRPWHRCFPVNFAKFSSTPFLQNTSERLLLYIDNASENHKLLGRNSLNDFNFYVPCHSSETQIITTKI